MEKILTDIVKEKGISKIIMEYKKQFDNITFCSCCKSRYDDLIIPDEKLYSLSQLSYPAEFFHDEQDTGETFCRYCIKPDEFPCYERYRIGRHGVYRKVSDEDY